MTDQQHPITPPHDKVYWWWEEACKRPSSFYEKLDYVAEQAAQWGWQQRDAGVPSELQEARDEELEECCEWVEREIGHGREWGAELRRHRRPKPKNLADKALDALEVEDDLWPVKSLEKGRRFDLIRRALKRLQELEGQA